MIGTSGPNFGLLIGFTFEVSLRVVRTRGGILKSIDG
jgi:hypothetical protein